MKHSDSRYSLLLMRDDGHVKRIRVSPLALRLLVAGLFLLPVLTGLGTWAAVSFWQGNTALVDSNRLLERELKEARVELERLSNLETLLRRSAPETLDRLVAPREMPRKAAPPTAKAPDANATARPDNGPVSRGATSADSPANGLADNGQLANQEDAADEETAPRADASIGDIASSQPSSTSPPVLSVEGVAATTATPPSPDSTGQDISPLNAGQARVDSVQVQLIAGGKARITFNLSNTDGGRLLSGNVNIYLMTPDKKRLELSLPPGTTEFRITRFKKIVTSARLPQGLQPQDVHRAIIEIDADDKGIIYRDAFPVQQR